MNDLEVEPRTILKTAAVLVLNVEMEALTIWSNTYGGVTLPGGKVEPEDPSVPHAAVRELDEEACLVAQLGDLRLLHKERVKFRLRGGVLAPEREVHLFYARRVAGRARSTAADRPLDWAGYTKLIAKAPAFYADFYQRALPPSTGFTWLEPTEGA
ncbi:MAG TPA: NUDIX domain-containing protein [Thermoleophilia bacterium]|nr:NUDIX domain-containing protein [Thermoleophilia bacterium]